MKKRAKWESMKIDSEVLDIARAQAKKRDRSIKATIQRAIIRYAEDDTND